jgi:hypothetical protein
VSHWCPTNCTWKAKARVSGQKAFGKIQHPFMIKALKKLGTEGTFLNIMRFVWQTSYLWGKTGTISSKIRNKARVPTLPTLIQHSVRIPSQSNKIGERNTRDSNREGRSQIIPICRWYDPIPERPYKLNQKLLDLINTFSEVAGYKINMQKSVFLHTNNE